MYFDPVVLNSAVVAGICKSCKKQYAAKAGCTSGLRSHLGKCDPNQWQKVVNEQQTRLTASQQKDEMSAQNMDKWLRDTGAKRAEKWDRKDPRSKAADHAVSLMYFIIYIFLTRLRYVSLSFFLFPFFLILSLSFFLSHFYTSFLHSHSFTFIFALSIFLNLSFYLFFLLIRWVHSFIRLLFFIKKKTCSWKICLMHPILSILF